MKENIDVETIHDIECAAIAIERTSDFFQVAQQLSEFITAYRWISTLMIGL